MNALPRLSMPFPEVLRSLSRAATLLLVAGCSAAAQTAPEPGSRDPNAATVIAEIALERGDCKTAAETYATAAQRGDVDVARRASEVALGCEHLPAAWEATKRWRALAPNDRDAAAVYATVALKLYRIPEARAGIATVLKADDGAADKEAAAKPPAHKSPPSKARSKPKDGAPGAGADSAISQAIAAKDPDARLAELTALLLEQADAPAVLAAVSGAVATGSASPAALALLAELSLEAYDVKRAEQYANLALKKDPNSYDAKHVIVRAYVAKGDANGAIAAARELMRADPKRGAFELAETLASLDRLEEARRELDRIRAEGDLDSDVDRRLALLAYQGGDFAEAQRRFTELATSSDASDAALLYLAQIAERDGDADTALAGYRRLANSSLAIAARSRAAAILMDKKERGEALTLLDDYVSEHPEKSFDMTITKAHLLADHGESEAGIALLSTALDKHPQHPALQYDRAVLLERAGRVKEAVAALEHLLAERPDDPTLLNALGYTMADHDIDLSKAESYIRKSLAMMPDNPAVLDSLGWVRFRRGDSRGAVEQLARAYALAHDPEIAAHWGEALWQSGNQAEARRVWAAALARDPDSDPLKATVARLTSPGKK
ncbi:MAG TPA: tetratricopeptide repeat protein [Steroidobacteraceae bacterium]|nr:tetratricopeptide repeat protein [Steroidobacteraceae bacterium]